MNLSILHRLLLVATLVLGVFAVIIPFSQIAIFASTLEDRDQSRLVADARTVLAAMQIQDGRLVMPDSLVNPNFNQVESDLVAAIFDETGRIVWRSSSASDFLPDYHPSWNADELVFTRMGTEGSRDSYFIVDWDVEIEGKTFSIVTGDNTRAYDTNLAELRRQSRFWLGMAFASLLSLLAAGLVWALRPLRRMYHQVLAIERGDKDALEGEYPAEISRLARGLNSLLEAERLRRNQYEAKVSDLAHGLKTPMAVISQACCNLPETDRMVIEDHVQHMNQLVNFHLQRALPTRSVWAVPSLDLEPVIEKLCTSLDKVYHEKNVYWDMDLQDSAVLITEAEALEIFGNLLDNAFRLCKGRVRVTMLANAGVATILVEDDGPGIPASIRSTIVERGTRADTMHAGQGIGLALVVEMLEEIHGELVIDDSVLGGACITVKLPRLQRKAQTHALFRQRG